MDWQDREQAQEDRLDKELSKLSLVELRNLAKSLYKTNKKWHGWEPEEVMKAFNRRLRPLIENQVERYRQSLWKKRGISYA